MSSGQSPSSQPSEWPHLRSVPAETTADSHIPWRLVTSHTGTERDSDAAELYAQLPVGALSLLQLGDTPESPANWRTPLWGICRAAIRAGRPVVYLECGGYEELSAQELRQAISSPLLLALTDPDECIRLPGTSARSMDDYYICNVPSLTMLAPRLRRHESAYGPSLVVLEQVDQVRPYSGFAVFDSSIARPPELIVTKRELDLWRARDITTFAERRTRGTTLAVCGAGPAADALREMARLVMRVAAPEGHRATVAYCRRASSREPWLAETRILVPED